MSFERRRLSGPETLGQRLLTLREERGVSLEQIAKDLNISPKHLLAIEESRYNDLPGKVYAWNFVRLYVGWTGLEERAALKRFEQEYSIATAASSRSRPLLVQRAQTEWPWWRRHSRILLAVGTVVLVLSYFGWQVYRLYAPPMLEVFEPAADVSTRSTSIVVSGKTVSGAHVSINGDEVAIDRQGAFRVDVDLQPGLNVLQISAKTQRSQPHIILRQVLREISTEPPAPPAA